MRDSTASGCGLGSVAIRLEGKILRALVLKYSEVSLVQRLAFTGNVNAKEEPNAHLVSPWKKCVANCAMLFRKFIHLGRAFYGQDYDGSFDTIYEVWSSFVWNTIRKPRSTELRLEQRLGIDVLEIRKTIFLGILYSIENIDTPFAKVQVIMEELVNALDANGETDSYKQSMEDFRMVPDDSAKLIALIMCISPYFGLQELFEVTMVTGSDKEFFITDTGKLGVAYKGVHERDVVTIWKGLGYPVILKPHLVDGKEAWRLHSMAYVGGIMNGEAWPESEEGLEDFAIH